jgi:hypothetical protein
MAETVYPLGLIWEDAIPDVPNPEATYSLRGNVDDIGSTYVENGSFDDPVLADPGTFGSYGFSWRERNAVLTGAPATVPANTTSVRLRTSGTISYEIDGYSAYVLPETTFTVIRTDSFFNDYGYLVPLNPSSTQIRWWPGNGVPSLQGSAYGQHAEAPAPPSFPSSCNWQAVTEGGLITPPTYPDPFIFETDFEMNFAEEYLPAGCTASGTTNPFPGWDNHDTIDMADQSLMLTLRYQMGFTDDVGPVWQIAYTFQNLSLELVVTTEALGGVFLNTFSVGGSIVG